MLAYDLGHDGRKVLIDCRSDAGPDGMAIDVDGNVVQVRLCGSCASCSVSQVTLKDFVESKLQELVLPELVVEEAD